MVRQCAAMIELILSLVLASHTHATTDDDRMRLHGVAQDVVAAVEAAPALPFWGPAAHEASAVALVAVAHHESGMWAKVQSCEVCNPESGWCDRGRSVTLFQLQGRTAWGGYSRQELCSSNAAATERALAVLARFSRSPSTGRLFDGYAGRSLGVGRAAREIDTMFLTKAKKAGLRVTYKCAGREASTCGLWAEKITR
jgi:hypothetical protein